MRYAISSSVKAPMQVDSPLCIHLVSGKNLFRRKCTVAYVGEKIYESSEQVQYCRIKA